MSNAPAMVAAQEDGRTERGLTYAFAATAAKTRARERPGFHRIAAACQAACNKTAPDRWRREMSSIAGTLASRSIERSSMLSYGCSETSPFNPRASDQVSASARRQAR